MVGTGVFTSLGLQAAQVRNPGLLLLLWVLGGIFALCGALSYGELSTALPRSGGEYHFLSRIYHPSVGFVAGWISGIVGFAAPLALAAMAFGKYFEAALPGTSPLMISIGIVILTALAHLFDLKFGALFQNIFTSLKLLLILGFILAGIAAPHHPVSLVPTHGEMSGAFGAPFAICLVYVMYAYSGWNASVYIAQEIDQPRRNLPRSLLIGTLLVTLLYVGLNAVFLLTTTLQEIGGQIAVGAISASHIFGPVGGRLASGLISLALISCISAMTWAGPRVWQVMGEDYPVLGFLSKTSAAGIPVAASLFQLAIVMALLLSSTFESVLVYAQFALNLCAFLTVLGVFILRRREPGLERPYRTWGYPYTPAAFLAICLGSMFYLIASKPTESLAAFGTIGLGFLAYLASNYSLRSLPSRTSPIASHEHKP